MAVLIGQKWTNQMGRLTEAFDYINQPHVPKNLDRYKRINPDELESLRRRVQEARKAEPKTGKTR